MPAEPLRQDDTVVVAAHTMLCGPGTRKLYIIGTRATIHLPVFLAVCLT